MRRQKRLKNSNLPVFSRPENNHLYSDAYFGARFHIWDIAAPSIIVTEAGGVVSDLAGNELNLMNRQIISACTKELINNIARKITPIEIPDPDGKLE